MKYILICLAAMVVCLILGYLIARLIRKFTRRPASKLGTILTTIGSGIVIIVAVALIYFSIHYTAGDKATAALNGSETVKVEKIDGGYFFDGPSSDSAIVFYAGAKVEAKAYAPLMLKLADAGFDCFLADMPFNFALLGSNAADKFISAYDYDTWLVAGHSMGGIVASSYAAKHSDVIDGVILLASYSTAKLDDSIQVCSIYGSNDGCLDIEQYQKHKDNLPENFKEYVIVGGNHAQYGDYGEQSGDGTAAITADEQQDKTVESILETFAGK